jgi:integrase
MTFRLFEARFPQKTWKSGNASCRMERSSSIRWWPKTSLHLRSSLIGGANAFWCVAGTSATNSPPWVRIGGLGTHSFRHTYRSWLDAVGTPITVQQKLMRYSDIRTTLNIHRDVVTNEMEQADSKVAALALKSDSRVIPAVVSH